MSDDWKLALAVVIVLVFVAWYHQPAEHLIGRCPSGYIYTPVLGKCVLASK